MSSQIVAFLLCGWPTEPIVWLCHGCVRLFSTRDAEEVTRKERAALKLLQSTEAAVSTTPTHTTHTHWQVFECKLREGARRLEGSQLEGSQLEGSQLEGSQLEGSHERSCQAAFGCGFWVLLTLLQSTEGRTRAGRRRRRFGPKAAAAAAATASSATAAAVHRKPGGCCRWQPAPAVCWRAETDGC